MRTGEAVPQDDPDSPEPVWVDTPEARDLAGRELWDWLVLQSQTVWLNIVRDGNPGDWLDWYWIEMVKHPRCDRGVASYLFWKLQPSHYLTDCDRPREDGGGGYGDIMAVILDRAERGGWPTAKIRYDRAEVALEAFETARTIATTPSVPFAIPRELCANFEGDNETPMMIGDKTIAQVDYAFGMLDGIKAFADSQSVRVHRRKTEEDHYDIAFRFPARSMVGAEMTDIQAITAVFGDWEPALAKVATLRAERATYYATARQSRAKLAAEQQASPKPARRMSCGVARFLTFNAIGASAMIAALHFVGPWAAVVTFALWLGTLLQFL